MIVERRFFLQGAAALAAAAVAGRYLPSNCGPPSPEELAFEPDPSGYYVACGFDDDGRLYLSEIINNRSIQRVAVSVGNISAVMEFLDQAGLPRVQFVNWHASVSDQIEAWEFELPWSDGRLPPATAERIQEALAWLSTPVAAAAVVAVASKARARLASDEQVHGFEEQAADTEAEDVASDDELAATIAPEKGG